MKILVVGDHESRKIWDFFDPGMLDEYALILSCGDLSPDYLQFLATMSKAQVVYVRGNHDGKYDKNPPLGCICCEDDLLTVAGVRILGFGGAMKYKDGPNLYTDRQMNARVRKLRLKLFCRRGFDILLTHAPGRDMHDGPDLPHRGFSAFPRLIDKYSPRYFLHGHVHPNYNSGFKRLDARGNTIVVNAYETYAIDYPDEWLKKGKR